MKRWVKIEDVWLEASRLYADLEWQDMRKHGYLPTHVGHEPPKE